MEMNETNRLVIVAHPGDELTTFSSVVPDAHVVAVTDVGSPPGAFEAACGALGAAKSTRLHLPAVSGWRLSAEGLRDRLAPFVGAGREVYTHDPLDPNPQHQDVALAAALVFGEVRVPAAVPPFDHVAVLSAEAFRHKLELLNTTYGPHLEHPSHPDDRAPIPACEITARAPVAIEAFARTGYREAARAASLTHYDLVLSETPDTWGFERSPYEAARMEATSAVLSALRGRSPPETILELGACEGLMTERLRAIFPEARIRAVEPDPHFADRLLERIGRDPNVELVRRSLTELPLEADLVVAAEVLYYVANETPRVLDRLRAPYLLTSYHGAFDRRLSALVARLGFAPLAERRLPVQLEVVSETGGPFVVRRVGANVRLWQRAEEV